MAVVTKERQLVRFAKIELRNIPRLPERLDVTRGPSAQAFLQQTGLYFLAHPDPFPDDLRKIIFMLTNLSGDTAKWAQPLNQRVLNESDPDVTPPNLAEFLTIFNSYFLNPERKGKVQQALCTFKQSGNVESYSSSMYTPTIPLGATISCIPHPCGHPGPGHATRQQT
ncbi:uncharacterized protein VP01_12008g1 [Puccinia sorghi]|uniref:Retrotransposon gag domain-containing protein n=1 Tax=Puccinia sorghi TaxID=27349 RepID=A0A0L6VQK7_9BASI|nr:uncharacterized protein VP01_12008g1 [Puccinia sorghi]